jgi:hypothetical protein
MKPNTHKPKTSSNEEFETAAPLPGSKRIASSRSSLQRSSRERLHASGAGSSGASFRPSDTRGDGAPVWCAQRLPNAAAWSRANSAMPRASIPVRSFTAEVIVPCSATDCAAIIRFCMKKCGFTTVNERPHPAISASERACRRLLRFGASHSTPGSAHSARAARAATRHRRSRTPPRRCGGATDRRYAGPWPWPGRERDRSSDGRSPAGIGSRRR